MGKNARSQLAKELDLKTSRHEYRPRRNDQQTVRQNMAVSNKFEILRQAVDEQCLQLDKDTNFNILGMDQVKENSEEK